MGQVAATIPQGPYFTVTGWILLSADQSILDISSEPELLFVSLLRNDLAISTGTSMNMISVVLIEGALASEVGPIIHLHVNFEMTTTGDQAAATALLQILIDQSTNSSSLLAQGSVSSTVEHVGAVRGTVSQCEAVYLGPDIGFVNIMEYHDSDGSCTISMSELATVCSNFFAQCLCTLNQRHLTA